MLNPQKMIITIVILIAGLSVFSDPVSTRLKLLLAGNPIEPTSSSVAYGSQLFAENCSSCHGPKGGGDGPMAAELATKPADFGALNRPPAVLAMRIQFGVGQDMPQWRNTLSELEIWHLVNYLEALAQQGTGRDQDRWWKASVLSQSFSNVD